jgi:sRNA-binding carbon storage regulator CsrA
MSRAALRLTIPAPRHVDRAELAKSLQHWKREASVALGHIADLERLLKELDD